MIKQWVVWIAALWVPLFIYSLLPSPQHPNSHLLEYSVYRAMPVMFLYVVVDSTKCVTLNILRSTGRPQITVWGNLVACLAIMLPLGWVLAVKMSYGKSLTRFTAGVISTVIFHWIVWWPVNISLYFLFRPITNYEHVLFFSILCHKITSQGWLVFGSQCPSHGSSPL